MAYSTSSNVYSATSEATAPHNPLTHHFTTDFKIFQAHYMVEPLAETSDRSKLRIKAKNPSLRICPLILIDFSELRILLLLSL